MKRITPIVTILAIGLLFTLHSAHANTTFDFFQNSIYRPSIELTKKSLQFLFVNGFEIYRNKEKHQKHFLYRFPLIQINAKEDTTTESGHQIRLRFAYGKTKPLQTTFSIMPGDFIIASALVGYISYKLCYK